MLYKMATIFIIKIISLELYGMHESVRYVIALCLVLNGYVYFNRGVSGLNIWKVLER